MNRLQILLTTVALLIAVTTARADDNTTPTIGGSVFGGGRMANVSNTTQAVTATVDIYASTIGSVFGGNDITGEVKQGSTASSKVIIHDDDDNSSAITSINEVYGGGNGYYKYKIGDADPIAIGGITDDNKSTVVAANTKITALDVNGNEVANFTTTAATTYEGLLPTLGATSVNIGDASDNNNNIYIGEVYGGAKNAYVTSASSVTVNSGTMTKAFAGNNYGGSIAASSITVNATKMSGSDPTTADAFKALTDEKWAKVGAITFDETTGVASTDGYGIGEAYGGGNAVDVTGNANVTVNGGYIKTLFGGNNLADMAGVPAITFGTTNSIYINTIYGGGNAGDMKGAEGLLTDCSGYLNQTAKFADYTLTTVPIFVGTDVQVNSATLFVANVYGGCRAANVDNSTLVHITAGAYIGNVFGGCDISGSVGKNHGTVSEAMSITKMYDGTTAGTAVSIEKDKAMTDIGTNVILTTGAVESVFGGGNGDYDYTSDAYKNYAAAKPTVKSSWVDIRDKATFIYGGGNAANIETSTNVCLYGAAVIGTAASGDTPAVLGAVYGGCKSADVTHATNVFMVNKDSKNPTVNGNVFGACDISGNVGSCITSCLTGTGDAAVLNSAIHLTAEPTSATTQDYAYVDIQAGTVTGRVFGGGNGLQDAAGTAYYTGTLKQSSDITTDPTSVFSYPDGETYAGKLLPQVQNTWVTVKNATVGPSTFTGYTNTLFSGGQGLGTRVWHNAYLAVGDGDASSQTTNVYGTVYGGSYAGIVNTSCDDCTDVDIAQTVVKGDVYGGSYGNDVYGAITLTVAPSASVTTGTYTAKIDGADTTDSFGGGIYAANNSEGTPKCEVTINYGGGTQGCENTIYGGGNFAEYDGDTHIVFTTGEIGYIYGGGNHADVTGNTLVEVLGGKICHDVFGGGNQGKVEGNTKVVVRNDCLKVDGDGNFVMENGQYVANRVNGVLTPNSTSRLSTIEIVGNVYGGGNQAKVMGTTTVQIGNDCTTSGGE